MSDQNESGGDAKRSSMPDLARASSLLAIALVVAVFTALGLQGDLLVRAVRDHPRETFLVFAAVIIGLAIAATVVRKSKAENKVLWIVTNTVVVSALILVVGGTCWAVSLATESIGDRENPAIQISPHWADAHNGQLPLTITASGTSLRSSESMLLRVVALKPGAEAWLGSTCRSGSTWYVYNKTTPVFQAPGYLLSWGITGPDVSGKVSSTMDVIVDTSKIQYVCAYAGLLTRPKQPTASAAYVIVDVKSAHPKPTGAPAPTK